MASARRRGFMLLATVTGALALAWAAYWSIHLSHFESTDDAYVSGDVIQVTSEVPGTVLAVHADDTQTVVKGTALVDLDPSDATIAVATAEAELAHAVRDVSGYYAQYAQAKAEAAAREATRVRVASDLKRREPLLEGGAISAEELAHSKEILAEQSAASSAAQARADSLEVQVHGTTLSTHPRVLQAADNVRSAYLALRRSHLVAPIDGVVAKRIAQIGERVAPGMPLLSVVALSDVWIDANFKEAQLRRLRVGQPVTMHTDVYGADVVYHGQVAGLSAGSGSAFALLPAQNATGNWIKIVQRVPVRIRLDATEVAKHALRLGLSADVRVDVTDSSGPLVTTDVRAGRMAPQLVASDNHAVDERIAEIIAANGVKVASKVHRRL
jgi:membrane fusion protein (multidrug efflux system)